LLVYSSQLSTVGRVALLAAFALCIRLGTISAHAQSSEPVDELSAGSRSSESFAPTVKKVAPAVVRIVTAVKADVLARLADARQTPFRTSSPGLVPEARPGRLIDCGLGSGVIVTED